MARLGILALGCTVVLGCADITRPQCACTEEFRSYAVTVVDDAFQPVNNATLVRTNLRTGRVLEPGWLGLLVPGSYLVADDGLRDEFSGAGDTLRVVCSQGGVSVTADFVFATPAPCRCHLELRSGPDTVIIGDPGR
jgi:hypothetical protein